MVHFDPYVMPRCPEPFSFQAFFRLSTSPIQARCAERPENQGGRATTSAADVSGEHAVSST